MAKILIVDDEHAILLMLKKMLEKAGHEVDIASNGNEGIILFEKNKYNLLITDIIMPEKEGIETIIELHNKYPDLKIIAISGGGRIGPDGYLSGAKLLGANMVFQKPLIQKTFLEAVTILLNDTKGRIPAKQL
jgi:CheY-like chemotaxis protein